MSRYKELFKQVISEHEKGVEETNVNSNILIFDGLNTFIRVFSAIPALNDNGDHIGGVTGFLRSIAAAIRKLKPTRCIIVFDGKGGSKRRKKLFPEYKANRAVKTKFNRYNEFLSHDEEQASMYKQFARVAEYLDYLPILSISIDNIEADDAIAYIANEIFTLPEQKVKIVSTDRDFLQLVNDRISVWSPIKKKLYTPELLKEETGLSAENYLLYRIFAGDITDNIPGVKGVALKSLIKYFPIVVDDKVQLSEILDYATKEAKDTKYKIYNRVLECKDQIFLNEKLMQLKQVDISGNIKMLISDRVNQPINKLNTFGFKKMFMADKMFSIIKDIDTWLNTSFNTLNAYRSLQKN